MGVEEEEEEGVLVRRCLREMQWKLMRLKKEVKRSRLLVQEEEVVVRW